YRCNKGKIAAVDADDVPFLAPQTSDQVSVKIITRMQPQVVGFGMERRRLRHPSPGKSEVLLVDARMVLPVPLDPAGLAEEQAPSCQRALDCVEGIDNGNIGTRGLRVGGHGLHGNRETIAR
ncbi:MAG: hypothetical protein KC594_17780, partial [Nitrospira sp.]|nr:hypothetical protein [Nitrospira sp.]